MAQDPSTGPAVSVSGLSKTYESGGESITATDDVSFEIDSGQVVGLLGPNGAGKTTTIKSMLGIVIPDSGTVKIDGIDIHQYPQHAYNKIGAMLEGTRNVYWRLTVMENLRFFAGMKGVRPGKLENEHKKLLEKLDLTDRADTPVNDLSRGMKQKVSLASTLASDVSVVLMDEPTLGLDVETSLELRSELRRLAKSQNVTVILSSHDMDVIQELCDSVIILQNGSVVTHEPVNSILGLFKQKEIELVVEEALSRECKETLRQRVDAQIEKDSRTTIRFSTDNFNSLSVAANTLNTHDHSLYSVQSEEPDLEEAFLEITDTSASQDNQKRQTTRSPTTGEQP